MKKGELVKQKLKLENDRKELLNKLKETDDTLLYVIWELNRINNGRSIKLVNK